MRLGRLRHHGVCYQRLGSSLTSVITWEKSKSNPIQSNRNQTTNFKGSSRVTLIMPVNFSLQSLTISEFSKRATFSALRKLQQIMIAFTIINGGDLTRRKSAWLHKQKSYNCFHTPLMESSSQRHVQLCRLKRIFTTRLCKEWNMGVSPWKCDNYLL